MPDALHEFFADPSDVGLRLDTVLAARTDGVSRSRIQALIKAGNLLINNIKIIDASYRIKGREHLALTLPDPVETQIVPYDFKLAVIYEDEDLLVIDKPAGLTVHPAPGHPDKTLVNALLAHCGSSLSGIGGERRPGIVHRLDKDTSGLMVVAKHDNAHRALAKQLAERTMSRTYWAFVWGRPAKPEGTIRTRIGRSPRNRKKMAVLQQGGRDAVTHYQVLGTRYAQSRGKHTVALCSLVACKLQTGRTHQIRVHLAHIGHPLIGDPLYGAQPAQKLKNIRCMEETSLALLSTLPRQALHAVSIEFMHPASQQLLSFSSGLPQALEPLHRIVLNTDSHSKER